MKIDIDCLQHFFVDTLPSIDKLENALSLHSFETEIDENGKLDVDILPNRSSDGSSYYGIAKELSSILSFPLKRKITQDLEPIDAFGDKLTVSVDDDRCHRYKCALITGVSTLKLPKFIIDCLEASGMRSINPIVDVTNYVMLELGLPMHAFELNNLQIDSDGKFNISIRKSKSKEQVKTLSTEKYNVLGISADTMLIVDGNSNEPIAIAGIKGLETAGITKKTDSIILEAAVFNHSTIRETVADLKLFTDASNRYSRNLSIAKVDYALARAIEIFREYGTNIKIESVVDSLDTEINPYKVGVSSREISNYLGVDIVDAEVNEIFKRLEFDFVRLHPREEIIASAEKNIGKKYKYGASVSKDAPLQFDCSSFTAYCYANAGIQIPRVSGDQYLYSDRIDRDEALPGDLIFMRAFTGAVKTYTEPFDDFIYKISGKIEGGVDHIGIVVDKNTFIMAGCNPAKEVVKVSMSDIEKNYKIVGYGRVVNDADETRFVVNSPIDRIDITQREDLIEEFARMYGYENIPNCLPEPTTANTNVSFYLEQEILEACKEIGFSEIKTSTFTSVGEIEVLEPKADNKPKLRSNLSNQMADALKLNILNADLLGITQIKLIEIGTVFLKDREEIRICFGIADLKEHKSSGQKNATEIFDVIKNELNKNFKLNLEGNLENGTWEAVIKTTFNTNDKYPVYKISEAEFKEFSKYPSITRDISLFVPKDTPISDLESILKTTAGELFANLRMFDKYEKADKVSYAFRIVFQSKTKTLTDIEIKAIMDEIYSKFNSKNYKIR